MLDTGWVVSVLSEESRRGLKPDCTPHDGHMSAANGSLIFPIGQLTLRVSRDSRVYVTPFVVVPNYSHYVNLGWEFLSNKDTVI